jgi:homeobox protein cut-like
MELNIGKVKRRNCQIEESGSRSRKVSKFILDVLMLASHVELNILCSTVVPKQKEAEMTRLITDLGNYKDVLQKTETRLGKKIKDLTTQLTAKVSYNIWIIMNTLLIH